ncbi:MAG: hypothetical protein AAGA75_14005 [Cyanobacteria bacterium P01_E01_bin.6]
MLQEVGKYLDEIKAKTPNPVPPDVRAAQDLEGYVYLCLAT